MILFPAIDLKDGSCVRLLRGDMDAATVFNDSPSDQARAFVDAGADWLHIVDLNGAFDGQSVNGDAVRGILDVTRAAGVQVQLGGGLRTPDHVAGWLADGVDRVILGTAAVKDPALVIESCKAYPDRVAVGVDARGGARGGHRGLGRAARDVARLERQLHLQQGAGGDAAHAQLPAHRAPLHRAPLGHHRVPRAAVRGVA